MRNKFTRYMAIILDVSLDALTDMSETKIHALNSNYLQVRANIH